MELVSRVQSELGITAMAHLTCVGHTRDELREVVDRLIGRGVQNVLALRGDPPKGETEFVAVEGGFRYGSELAAFSQFVQPGVPIGEQMWIIVPTALTLTALSYAGYTALGAGLGRAALGAVFNAWVRRVLAASFVIYGVLLGSTALPERS